MWMIDWFLTVCQLAEVRELCTLYIYILYGCLRVVLHTVIWYHVFLSNTNDLRIVVRFEIFLFNINDLYTIL